MYSNYSYYNTYQEIQNYITEFNKNNEIELSIDTIRITFSKEHKLNKLQVLGKWHKLDKSNENIKRKLNKRLDINEVTTVYQYKNENIYFYNSNKDKKYKKAIMVIYGLKQYHKEPPNKKLVEKIVNILTYKTSKNECNIDVCCDLTQAPFMEKLEQQYQVKKYTNPSTKKPTETYYINNTGILMIDKICFYNKAFKNNLDYPMYRIEATISIANLKALFLPLNEFKSIIKLTGANK